LTDTGKLFDRPNRESIVWRQFRNGDKKAFATLFELTSDRLFRYGKHFVADSELVKDCIQELFTKLYENQREAPLLENPIFYLFKSLKNLLIDELRRSEKMVHISLQDIPFHVKFVYNEREIAETDEDIREKFERVISFLSDRQKEAIYLRFQSEMSYEEISELLGINYQSTRNLIHRSIEKIRAEIGLKSFFLLFSSIH
jgi:RNA polymerase sigma factor (sigma-70 family)